MPANVVTVTRPLVSAAARASRIALARDYIGTRGVEDVSASIGTRCCVLMKSSISVMAVTVAEEMIPVAHVDEVALSDQVLFARSSSYGF